MMSKTRIDKFGRIAQRLSMAAPSVTPAQISDVMKALRARVSAAGCTRTREQAQYAARVRWTAYNAKKLAGASPTPEKKD